MITDITKSIAWNDYHIVNIDSGATAVTQRYKLEHIPFLNHAEMEGFTLEPMEPDAGTKQPDEAAPYVNPNPSRKWAGVSEASLAKLQANRHSKHTDNSTRWAVRIFRGEHYFWASRFNHAKCIYLLFILVILQKLIIFQFCWHFQRHVVCLSWEL